MNADSRTTAWIHGFLGMLIFSGSLPATRLALQGFDPYFLTYARAAIAGLAASALLLLLRQRWPRRDDLLPLTLTAIGVVLGFPLLTAYALQHITASRAVLFVALLPLATAIFAVLRAGERPRLPFWLFSLAASGLVMAYTISTNGVGGAVSTEGAGAVSIGDLAMLGAILVCGLGYAEGARLSRRLGGWQVICWALLLSLPPMLILAFVTRPASLAGIALPPILALLYVSFFSMLIGFVFWYRGLAQGGIASVGQLQYLQPFFGLVLASLILGERIGWPLVAVMALVILCVAGARRYA